MTKKAIEYGYRVQQAKIKESAEMGITLAAVTLAATGHERGLELARTLGESVRIHTAKESREIMGRLYEVKLTVGKDDQIAISGKVSGSRNLADVVGLDVGLEQLQMTIPEVDGRAAAAGEGKRTDEVIHADVCSDCSHPWASKTKGAIKGGTLQVFGHSRKSGKCSVLDCKCGAFMP